MQSYLIKAIDIGTSKITAVIGQYYPSEDKLNIVGIASGQSLGFKKGQMIGGFIFGLGWAITGACPGPLFAQIGSGYSVVLVTLVAALAGTWVYGRFEKYFPN